MEAGALVAGKYRLNRLLGSGGMASVWAATNIFTDREFAVKVMATPATRNADATRRFLLEAKVSARINHPNIIEILDVGQTEDGQLFLVMELLHGLALDALLKRPPVLARDFCRTMLDVARALDAAHRAGVIHRDLKPSNIFLHRTRGGITIPKVLDFGVSKILEDEPNFAHTIAGTVLGSPLYMSPEQAGGTAHVDGRSDIFSFGAILFEACTGRRPYDAPNFNALIVTIATTPPRDVDTLAPQLPQALRSLIRACLMVRREDRLSSFSEISHRLEAIINELDVTAGEPSAALSATPSATLTLPAPFGVLDADATDARAALGAAGYGASTLSTTSRSGAPPGLSSPWSTAAPPPPARGVVRWLAAAGIGAAVGLGIVATVAAVARGGNRPAVSNAAPVAVATESENEIGTVSFWSVAGACRLEVDGAARGATPLTVELGVGNHYVACTFGTASPVAKRIRVEPHSRATVQFSPAPERSN
jgi:serine/threonine-protein kinase